ncbi:MAG: hypothetical protein OYH77_06270 [Pseudomonadota bacterium]|nr:hypothetical protein [Pseudomonadota bacterium]
MRNVLATLPMIAQLSCQAYTPDAEPKAAPTFANNNEAEMLAKERRECMDKLTTGESAETYGDDLVTETEYDQLFYSEKIAFSRIMSLSNKGVGYYRYKDYSIHGGRIVTSLAIDDDVCYCLLDNQFYKIEITDRTVDSPGIGRYDRHGLLRIEVTDQSSKNFGKKKHLEFALDTNAIHIRRKNPNSCNEFVISVDHGGHQEDGSNYADELGQTKIKFNVSAPRSSGGQVFSKLDD